MLPGRVVDALRAGGGCTRAGGGCKPGGWGYKTGGCCLSAGQMVVARRAGDCCTPGGLRLHAGRVVVARCADGGCTLVVARCEKQNYEEQLNSSSLKTRAFSFRKRDLCKGR